jgi:hypothetical protein
MSGVIQFPEDSDTTPTDRIITKGVLTAALLSSAKLASIEIPPRENFCGTWFKQGDLGFIFGERGLGKTWLTLDLATGLANGRKVGPWEVSKPRRVLYVDGEMPLDGMRDRLAAIEGATDGLLVLNHEWLFQDKGCVLNLSGGTPQGALIGLCESERIEVLILDNLSCLFSGMKENEADAWEIVLPWLLELRRRKVAVIIVHHAGRAGTHMRGTSRREDAAFWVMRLDATPDIAGCGDGARFITRFTKTRQGTREETEPLQWHYEPVGNRTRASFTRLKSDEIFRQWIRDGLDSCSDIAAEMGLTKGAISKMAKRGEREKWLRIVGRTYKLSDEKVVQFEG